MSVRQNKHLTFKANVQVSRHGWLRLTPAYSYRLVRNTIKELNKQSVVLDPFSGTGTTGLAAAEDGMSAVLVDVNPFLVWFAQAKTRNYSHSEIDEARDRALRAASLVRADDGAEPWIPALHNIERWWSTGALHALAQLREGLAFDRLDTGADSLLAIAFCRAMIDVSNAAFNHQSMSFQSADGGATLPLVPVDEVERVITAFSRAAKQVIESASVPLEGAVRVELDDSRALASIADQSIDFICTSPPYANRMSYIRELRPYMYWLGFLADARDAGELDWKAIGGTWGIATSRVADWCPVTGSALGEDFSSAIEKIASSPAPNAPLLANYVHKYFLDLQEHLVAAHRVVRRGGAVSYVVGNSTFYGVTVPTERWYADLLTAAGFGAASAKTIRKRNSKKELFEFEVTAERI